jgi:hypothetical protein
MNTIAEIKEAVAGLSTLERAVLRAWLDEFDQNEWDHKLEADLAAGRLDWLIQESKDDSRDRGRNQLLH